MPFSTVSGGGFRGLAAARVPVEDTGELKTVTSPTKPKITNATCELDPNRDPNNPQYVYNIRIPLNKGISLPVTMEDNHGEICLSLHNIDFGTRPESNHTNINFWNDTGRKGLHLSFRRHLAQIVTNQEKTGGNWGGECKVYFDSVMDRNSTSQELSAVYQDSQFCINGGHDKVYSTGVESHGLTNYIGYEHVGGGDPMFGDVLELTYTYVKYGAQKPHSDEQQPPHGGSQYQRQPPNALAKGGTKQAPQGGYVLHPNFSGNPLAGTKYDPGIYGPPEHKQSPYGGYDGPDARPGEYGAHTYGCPEGYNSSSYGRPGGYGYDPSNPAPGGYGAPPQAHSRAPPGEYGAASPPQGGYSGSQGGYGGFSYGPPKGYSGYVPPGGYGQDKK